MESTCFIADDLALFALLKQGDTSAFKEIYDKYWQILFNAAYKRLKDKEKCQDIIQNVFTDLWNRKEDLDIQNPQAYLHTAIRFQVLKAISRQSKQTFFVDSFETEVISSLNTDERLLEKDVRKIISHFIEALPHKRRTIFIMHFEQELNTAQIAHELDISQKTVQNQLHTASHALRLRLTHILSSAIFFTLLLQNY